MIWNSTLNRRSSIKRSRVRRISNKKRRINAIWAAVTQTAIALVHGICQTVVIGICTNVATLGHHILPRSQGGPHTLANCLPCCFECHLYIHANPTWSYENGLLKKRSNTSPSGESEIA